MKKFFDYILNLYFIITQYFINKARNKSLEYTDTWSRHKSQEKQTSVSVFTLFENCGSHRTIEQHKNVYKGIKSEIK